MAGASNIQWCEPCGREGENQQAHSWCSDCSEPLCGECLKFHRKGKTTANHKTIPILEAEKLGSSVLNIPDTCHIHEDQKLSLFCVQHDAICCAFCLRESHITCKDVKSIEQASKGVKMGTAIDDVQHRISEFSFMISKMLDVYKHNLSSLSDQKAEYKGKITNFRKELDTFLETLEQEIDTKFDACNKECKKEIEKIIKDLTTRKNKSESRQTAIETLTEHASETRIFAAIKTIDFIQVEEEAFLSTFQEGSVAYEIRYPPFDLIEKIKPVLASITDINIEKIKITVQHSLNPQQVHAYKLQQRKPKLLHKINCSKLGIEVFGKACLTMDNHIVFVGDQLGVYDISTSSVHTIQTEFSSVDVICDVKNNVYASFPAVGLYRIDIKNLIEGPCIATMNSKDSRGDYFCIKHNNDLLYTTSGGEIFLFNKEGKIVKTLLCKVIPTFMCVEKRDGIYISNGNSLMNMSESGSIIRIPTDKRCDNDIKGIDVDEQGRLYACISTEEVGSIVRINTTTGYMEPVLENLVTPRDIAFHPTKNMFLVITDKGKECTVYQVGN